MKKSLFLFCVALFAAGVAAAQQPAAPNPCNIVVTGDFDSECFYDYKDDYFEEYPDLMIACKHSTVTYTAYTYTGTATVSEYIWEIYGDLSHTATGDHCQVNWSDDEWGMVVVSVVTSDGDTCTESRHVKLIDNPTVGAVTIPTYTVMSDGTKVIYVCDGMSVTFIDQSDAGNSDIAGIHWVCTNNLARPSSTPTYSVENVYMNETVTHRVYNNCGCYDEEVFYIEVLTGEALVLDCYGTVCEGAVVEYHATAPGCDVYRWYVEGGTIIGGQGTAYPIVQWDHPENGYGVIGLDGNLCGEEVCSAMMSKRIPVIQNHLAIEGQDDVCAGEAVVFSLPLFGSTKYTWSITPATGIDSSMINNSNEIRIVFLQAGTYTLRSSYQCEFLGCGPYKSEDLIITVKPKFAITGNNRICVANACDLQTTPSVAATWMAYDLGNGNAVVGSPATGTSFSRTFANAGRYLITAENTAWCGPATFVLEVKDVPPAPTIADLNPANRHTACPNQGIVLNGTPPEQNYNLVWAPACSTATPQLYSGDSVTISYQSEVCDVRVYNYDMVLQCMSTDYYVHQVTALTPAPLNLPPTITACPGTVINWTTGQIPDQRSEGMLYEWTIEDNKQHCVSVQGSHFNPGIILAVNDISTPETLFVRLRRTFCGGSVDTTIYIFVPGEITESLNISGPGNVCVGSSASFTGSGGSPATYRWEIDGTQHTNNPVSHTFLSEGYSDVRLCSNPFTYCTNLNYYNCTTKTVLVTPLPTVYDIVRNGMTVSLLPANLTSPAYSFYWTVQATASSSAIYIGNTPTVTLSIPGTYSCTVTDNNTGCSRTLQKYLPDVIGCDTMTLSTSYNACTHTLTLISPQYPANVIWDVRGGNYSIVTSGTNNRQADVTFEDIGTYSITARTGYNQCYKGTYVKTIDYIPDFEFEQACGNINIINNSRYVSPGNTIYMTVTNSCNNSVDIVSMPINHSEYTYAPTTLIPTGTCTYYFKLSGYGANGNITPLCDLGDITVTMVSTPSNPVTITSANNIYPHNSCDNTPIELAATLNIPGLSALFYTWDFGDGSGYTTSANSVFHTFAYPGSFNISVTITDNYGCQRTPTVPFNIGSYPYPYYNKLLSPLGTDVCPFASTRDVRFTPIYSDNHYEWWRHKSPTHVVYGNPYPTFQSDDYFNYVINDNYCQAEATTFIKFKNAPTAHIYVENTDCCVENEVKLYGSTGPGDNNVTYAWSVSGLGITGSEANFAFSPPVAGTYTVTLTVTNTTTLCSSTTTETITAHPKPAAPTISFVGSDCISDAPLRLAATGYTGEMHWNNGATGTPAYYFTPGVVNAYYFDPTIGCNSDTANLTIIRQPDLDALLTGCYEKCKEQSTGLLPLYGLAAYYQQIWYQWDYPGGTITDNYLYDSHPLLLPYMIGNHYLTASAPSSLCPRTSSVLRIAGKEVCDCDSVDITYNVVPVITECTVTYSVEVVVCNRSKVNSFCIGEFEVLYAQNTAQIIYESLSGNTVAPNDCEDFLVKILVTSLVPSELLIRLTDDRCANCTKDFSIDLMPEINCTETMDAGLDDIKSDISSSVATYFDFHAYFTPGQNVLAFWTEPPMVVNYSYNISSGALAGLGMIDMATLTQLIAEGEKLCFYAIVCKNNTLCKQELCIDASNIYNIIMMRSAHAADSAKSNPQGDVGGLQLMPNPTTGDVNVVGTTDEVVDVVVMDMHGKEVATHEGTASFNVATLSSGTYIVRVKTRKDDKSAEMVAYLKLVKK